MTSVPMNEKQVAAEVNRVRKELIDLAGEKSVGDNVALAKAALKRYGKAPGRSEKRTFLVKASAYLDAALKAFEDELHTTVLKPGPSNVTPPTLPVNK